MKKLGVVVGMLFIGFVMTACNSTSETPSNHEEEIDKTETSDGEEGSLSDDDTMENDEENIPDDGGEGSNYTEEQVAGDYLIYADWTEGADLMLYFTRTTEEMTREERFHQSLMESDPSQRDLFSATTDFEVDGTVANLYFDEDDVLSMASTESRQFGEVFNEIAFRYGIDEWNLFNQDGERGIIFAENIWEESVEVEQEPNRGYYVMSREESERGEYTYISGAVVEEDIYTDDGELLDFHQTIEAMKTAENDEGAYYSGIYEGVEVEEATIDGNQAIVTYHINNGVEASQQEREDFEQVLQLAALDFQVEELQIVNETDKIISIYPLLNEMNDHPTAITDDNDNTESPSDTGGEKDSNLTEEEAIGNVFDYVDDHTESNREDMKAMIQDDEEEEGKFLVQVFVYSAGEDEEVQMTNTIGWYLVDKETGEVEEREL